MATLSNNDIARAIYLVTKDKKESELHNAYGKIIKFLSHKRLLSKSKDILERLDKIIDHENERITVKVLTKEKLKEGIKKELIFFLRGRYGVKEVILKESLNEKLIGGIRLEINDEIIDLTVKNKIKKLQEYLTRKI